jgi:hypothetical protein
MSWQVGSYFRNTLINFEFNFNFLVYRCYPKAARVAYWYPLVFYSPERRRRTVAVRNVVAAIRKAAYKQAHPEMEQDP